MPCKVYSHHLNIDEGDSAVHHLLNTQGRVISSVLIDGGLGGTGRRVLDEFVQSRHMSGYNRVDGSVLSQFDAVVVTHWDSDHADGLYNIFAWDLRVALQNYIGDQKITTKADLEVCIANNEILGSLVRHDGDNRPITRLHAPYWYMKDSNLVGSLSKTPTLSMRLVDGYICFFVSSILYDGTPTFVWIKGLLAGELGKLMIGVDLFTGERVMYADTPNASKSPLHVCQALAESTTWRAQPAMVCIGCDGIVCNPDGLLARANMVWTDNQNCTDLSKINLLDLQLAKRMGGIAAQQAEEEATVTSIDGHTTNNNLASVACIIAWPSQNASVSHYFAGDVGDIVEEQLLRWLAVPNTAGTRRNPVTIDCIKLSHHGSKLSTPLMMLFALCPQLIVASNGMRARFNHCSWEILVLIWVWTVWKNEKYSDVVPRSLFTTNYPIYLCKFWLKTENRVKYASPGSIASLTEGKGKAFRALIAGLQGFDVKSIGGSEDEKRDKVTELIAKNWKTFSGVSESLFSVDTNAPDEGIIKSENQKLRFIGIAQDTTAVRGFAYCGPSISEADATRDSDEDELDEEMDSASLSMKRPIRRLQGERPKLREELPSLPSWLDLGTSCNLVAESHQFRPRGMFCGERTFLAMKRDDGIAEEVQRVPPAPSRPGLSAPETSSHALARFAARVPLAVEGTATVVAKSGRVTKTPEGGALRAEATHVDLFLGELATASMVFKAKLPLESTALPPTTVLHTHDETMQWLMTCLGDTSDDECFLGAAACSSGGEVIKIKNFELGTKLRYAWRDRTKCPDVPFFQTPVVFSGMNNAHAFNIPADSTWPNVSESGSPDVVGAAQVLCVSLGLSPSLAGVSVSGTHILGMLGFKPQGLLSWLADLSSFELDTGPGKKNAIWFSPGPEYETTMRLCFKTAENSLLEKLRSFVVEIAGIDNGVVEVVSSNLIVKKTWTSARGLAAKTQRELTFLTDIKFKQGETRISCQTAITTSEKKLEWVLNFGPSGMTFKQLFTFIVGLFLKQGAPDFDVGKFLPGADKIALRRLMFTSWTEGTTQMKTLSVAFQVSFAGMTLLCSFYYNYGTGKSDFGISGRLFPENRPAKLGDSFTWIPYMPRYEAWTALEPAPAPNSLGVLQQVDGSDVGNLADTYKAITGLELGSCPVSLELVGLQFELSGKAMSFSAMVMTAPPQGGKVPALRLLGASLSLGYEFGNEIGGVSLSLETAIAMTAPDPSIPSALWNLRLKYDGGAKTWTLGGGVSGLRGSLLYSLCNDDCNSEMMQLLGNIILDLDLEYVYAPNGLGSRFEATGNLHLGQLELGATYEHKGDKDWSFKADLKVGKFETLLGDVVKSICGSGVADALPDCVKTIKITPVSDTSLTSFQVVALPDAFLVLVRLQITVTTSVAFYQYQAVRAKPADPVQPVKRILVFSVGQLPTVDDIPLIGSLPQPFDELRFLWVGDQAWTLHEVEALNTRVGAAGGFPRIPFKAPAEDKSEDKSETKDDASQKVVLKSGLHFCLIHDGETRLDYAFGKKKEDAAMVSGEVTLNESTTPVNLTLGPVKILGIGFDFDFGTQELKLVLDGTLQLGPIEMTLLGFSVGFNFTNFTLRDFKTLKPSFRLDGLGVAFQKDPITIAGLFERQVTTKSDLYLGGAVVGFNEWKFEAGGYYGTSKAETPETNPSAVVQIMDEKTFKSFMAYVRVSGPVATIGYAEIRGLVGAFGYNTSIKFPSIQNVMDFPFLAPPAETPSKALTAILKSGWFANKEGQNWAAAGLTVLAFETLTIQAVVVVEWGSGVKLGIFGLATAEMPKQLPTKFAVVQLGLVATVDFDGGVLKIDGQLTPASYVLDPSCHLTGGFALYSWFGPGAQQGDWVFTIGGYHAAFHRPPQYPDPPRLAISWRFDANVNITGEAYFAITPKACMGGGRLHVALTLGPLSASLDAYADFLINYRPFTYQATAGVVVGVHYTLDLWLVSVPISIDLGAIITLQGPPLRGSVHVDFYVFGFDIAFGAHDAPPNTPLGLAEFYKLVLQSAPKEDVQPKPPPGVHAEAAAETEPGPPHILTCTSGLVPPRQDLKPPAPGTRPKWVVRGAVFAFAVSCKFAVATARVQTRLSRDPTVEPFVHVVENEAGARVFAKPMHLETPIGQSLLEVEIRPPARPPGRPGVRRVEDPVWDVVAPEYSNLPAALWGRYDKATDPAGPSPQTAELLDGNRGSTAHLMSGMTLQSPKAVRSADQLKAFDVRKFMGQRAAAPVPFPVPRGPHPEWAPQKAKSPPAAQYAEVRDGWGQGSAEMVSKLAGYVAGLQLGGWDWADARGGKVGVPGRLIRDMEQWYIEAPMVAVQ